MDGSHVDDTRTLRIVSIFVILAAGLIGGFPPLFLKLFRDPDSTATRLVRSFSAGVIAALALVHIIPEAIVEMVGLGGIEYPLGGTCVLFGIALMVFLEHIAHIMHSSAEGPKGHSAVGPTPGHGQQYQRSTSAGLQHHRHENADAAAAAVPPPAACSAAAPLKPSPPCLDVPLKAGATATVAAAGAASPLCGTSAIHLRSQPSGDVAGSGQAPGAVVVAMPGGAPGHSHVCVSRGPASNWMAAAAVEAVGSLRLKVVAGLFELGCIFHSFIIGLSLGVNRTDLTEVRSLLIALAFHQWLEGISLASVVIRGGFSAAKGAAMILTYSLTCPVGIAVGMAIAQTYDEESERSKGVQGAFNGVSGGMLLYIALVQLVAEDMGRLVPGRDSARARLACFAALCGGAAAMCLLAVWA